MLFWDRESSSRSSRLDFFSVLELKKRVSSGCTLHLSLEWRFLFYVCSGYCYCFWISFRVFSLSVSVRFNHYNRSASIVYRFCQFHCSQICPAPFPFDYLKFASQQRAQRNANSANKVLLICFLMGPAPHY